MVTVCSFCNHAKSTGEFSPVTKYCKVLQERGEPSWLDSDQSAIDRSEQCNNSFAWNCDMEQIVRALDELYNTKLIVIRESDIRSPNGFLKQPKE